MVVADIAYDLYTSSTSGGSSVNEIIIWLANFNAAPLSAMYNSDGTPRPVDGNISLTGYTSLHIRFYTSPYSLSDRNVYSGSNGVNNVFSFLPSNGASITSFIGDLNDFLKVGFRHSPNYLFNL